VDPVFELRGVSKHYPGFALGDVSFSLPRGYVGGLIGPNGAGKTTIVCLLLGLVRADAGDVRVCGLDPWRDEIEVKRRIGFVHEVPKLWAHLSVDGVASIVSRFYPTWDQPLYERLTREFEVPGRTRVASLSRGTRAKAALALAMAHHAELLVLDEPTAGLDPVFRQRLLDRLAAYVSDGEASVLLSTHITSDLERLADFVTFVRDGRIVFSSTRDEIADSWAVVKGAPDLLTAECRALFAGWETGAHAFTGLTRDADAVRRHLPGVPLVVERASLEDIMFLMGRSC
jgi:ABC-2 type transport system ATP-binding protein